MAPITRTYSSARSPSGDSSRFQNRKRKDMEGKYCLLHNMNSHNMADCKVIREQISKMRTSWNPRSSNVAKHQKRMYQPDSKGKSTDETMYEFMAKMFNSNCLKKRKISNVKERQTPKEKIPSDDETLHAFEHLSILDSDDEGWDTMKKEYKNAADQHDDELEA